MNGESQTFSIHPETPVALLRGLAKDTDIVKLLGTMRGKEPGEWWYAIECRYAFPKYEIGWYHEQTDEVRPRRYGCSAEWGIGERWKELAVLDSNLFKHLA